MLTRNDRYGDHFLVPAPLPVIAAQSLVDKFSVDALPHWVQFDPYHFQLVAAPSAHKRPALSCHHSASIATTFAYDA